MLDLVAIRKDPEGIAAKIAKKGIEVDFSGLLKEDEKRRSLIFEVEQLKAERNRVSAEVPKLKKAGQDTTETLAQMKEVSDSIRAFDGEITELSKSIQDFLDRLPNIPHDDTVAGGKEANVAVKIVGEKPVFNFEPKHHVELVTDLGLIDYERGVKLGGNGYWIYTGFGAQIEWALLSYFINSHLTDGYQMMMVPHILTAESGYTAGQFPKFQEDVFRVGAGDDAFHFLLPTAETALVNLHRDEMLLETELPKKYFAYSPCYRREAGSYRADERGMIRGHQFNKVELFQYTTPENSDSALEELIGKAAALVEGLGLHFRVSKLGAGDCSDAMQKTYDIEVYIPSMGDYKEVSSASSAGDYQARRGNIRYRVEETGKPRFVHTLNASGLATSRVLPAIVEQYQQADGSVVIPEVLRPYLGGKEVIEPLK